MGKKRKKRCYCGIGGQAVLEGVMMKNQDSYAVAVRRPDGEIELKKENYIILAEGFNIPRHVILFNHMVRNSFSSIIIIATFTFASAIVTETSLSYLGVGIPIGIPSWGNMINGIQSYDRSASGGNDHPQFHLCELCG